jgi:hypothetical protein
MSPRVRAVDPGRLARWCTEHLGSPPADELFRSGFLSVVIGLRLADGREVVVKVRPDSPRTAACVEVQRRMFQAGAGHVANSGVDHQATAPCRSRKVPVGPSVPMVASPTIASVPSVTVCGPLWPLKSVAV